MLRLRDALVSMLFLASGTQTARAFIDPPWITPAEPRAGEIVSVNIRMGICDAIIFRPGYPQITREGKAIHILEYGNRIDFEDFCIYPIATSAESIGSFTPGDYALTVDFIYENYPDGYATITLGVVPFTVTRAPLAAPVPTTHPLGLFALMLLLTHLGVCTLRAQERSRC